MVKNDVMLSQTPLSPLYAAISENPSLPKRMAPIIVNRPFCAMQKYKLVSADPSPAMTETSRSYVFFDEVNGSLYILPPLSRNAVKAMFTICIETYWLLKLGLQKVFSQHPTKGCHEHIYTNAEKCRLSVKIYVHFSLKNT